MVNALQEICAAPIEKIRESQIQKTVQGWFLFAKEIGKETPIESSINYENSEIIIKRHYYRVIRSTNVALKADL